MNWFDVLGLIGVFFIVAAYLLLQTGKLSSDSIAYSLSNLIGALLIIVSLIFDFNLSAFIIEVFWFVFSVYGLFRIFKMKKKR